MSATWAQEPIVALPVEETRGKPKKWLSRSKKTPPATTPILQARPVRTVISDHSLSGLIAEALVNNAELRSARQNEVIGLAKGAFTRAGGAPLVAVYGTHDSQPAALFPGGRSEREAVGLSIEQPILDWGETRGKIQVDRQLANSHHWGAKVKELDVVYRVTEAYWQLVFFEEVIELYQANLVAKQSERQAVAQRVAAREARRAELLLIESGIAEAERDLLKSQNGKDIANAQLLYQTGRSSSGIVQVKDRLKESAGQSNREVCLTSHPEMKQAISAESAASSAERSARAGHLPKVLFKGHLENSDASRSTGTTNLIPDGRNYRVGAFVSVPVGRQRAAAQAKLSEAQANRIQRAAEVDALSQSLKLRILNAQNRVEEAHKSVTVAETHLLAANENYKLRKELLMINNATRVDVAKAEQVSIDAKVGVLKALYDVKVAQAHLEREQGRLLVH